MSDLVERLRGRRISASLRNDRTGELEMREIQDLLAVEAADRIEELEGVVRELLSYVESEYIGARGKDYSNGAIGRARAALGE